MPASSPAGITQICNLALQEMGQQPIQDIDDVNSTAASQCRIAFWPMVKQVGRAHNWNCLQKRTALVQLALPGGYSGDCTSIGWNTCGAPSTLPPYWAANTAYAGGTLVTWGEAIYYALYAHTSGTDFLTNLTAGLWAQIYSTFLGGRSPGGANGYEWDFGYVLPSDFLLISELNGNDCRFGQGRGVGSLYELFISQTSNPADHSISNLAALFTDAPYANVKYTALIVDPTIWDPLFTDCVVTLIASKIATPLRGDDGKMANLFRERYMKELLPAAMLKDAGEQKLRRYDPTLESDYLRSRRWSTNG